MKKEILFFDNLKSRIREETSKAFQLFSLIGMILKR